MRTARLAVASIRAVDFRWLVRLGYGVDLRVGIWALCIGAGSRVYAAVECESLELSPDTYFVLQPS